MNIDGRAISKLPKPSKRQLGQLSELEFCKVHYFNLIRDSENATILTEIKDDPRVKALGTHYILSGSHYSIFRAEHLGMWFLWACHQYGVENAKHSLNKFLDSETISVMATTWVMGIQVDQTIELGNGVRIVPIEKMPKSIDREHFLVSSRQIGGNDIPAPMAAVTHVCQSKKIMDRRAFYDDRNRRQCNDPITKSQMLIEKVITLLNVISGVSCASYLRTGYMDPEMPMGPFCGSGGNRILHDVLGYNVSTLAPNISDQLNELIEQYNDLPDKIRKRITISLSYLSQAKRRSNTNEKIIDLCIALEMLMLDDNSRNDQLSLTFRLRGSWLIGGDYQQRENTYNQLKGLYDNRSQVVHSGDLGPISDVCIDAYIALAEKIVCKRMETPNMIDWKELILGGKLSKITGSEQC